METLYSPQFKVSIMYRVRRFGNVHVLTLEEFGVETIQFVMEKEDVFKPSNYYSNYKGKELTRKERGRWKTVKKISKDELETLLFMENL